ncbi:MAG: UvrD-helicase domain-containing protein, partial [Crocinitomicaceae bacterium]|nr:UvrD-helicase domain-containing protein [Crocinitomicaceae bacterium]
MSASAGSGKTYQLVLQYLSIVLKTKSPNKFKGIVAITFTNKASLEMKTRIIDALFKLAKFKSSSEDKNTAEIIGELEKLVKVDEKEIVKRSGNVLKAILHGYENFNVSTIDKFNLRLIKSFSNDLDLPNEFEVSLNEKEVLEEVIDLLLNSIGESGNKDLTKLVKEYAKSNFRDGNQWNFKRQLMSFASSLNKEKNQGFIKTLMNISFDKKEYNKIQNKIDEINEVFQPKVDLFSEAFHAEKINEIDLPYKGQTYNALLKITKLTKCPIFNNEKGILSTRLLNYCEEEGDTKALTRGLKDLLLEIHKCYVEFSSELTLLVKYKANFFNMALLRYVFDALSEHKEKNKIIRISEFNELIGNLVQKEEAPYIYERFGVKYEHFLLDEFQDTSRLQWLNLLPLLRESLSNEKENLIVGDPKQSIYRFNNGLAEQFVSLPEIYNPEGDDYVSEVSRFFSQMGIKKPLVDNYR